MKKFFLTVTLVLLAATNLLAAQNLKKIMWEYAGNIPAQNGYEKNVGVAAGLSGNIGKYIVFGGGGNFPIKPLSQGGTKVLHKDLYLLAENGSELKVVDQITLDRRLESGVSINTKDGVYYVGGSPDGELGKEILFVSVKNGKLDVKTVGKLPFTFDRGFAVEKDGKIYVGSGRQNGVPSGKFYEFDLKTGVTTELESIPGEQDRTQPVGKLLNDSLVVFGGGNNIAYTNGFKYDFKTKKWSQAADIVVNGKAISLLGANSVKLNNDEMMVIGGFNKEVYDWAVSNMAILKNDELVSFRANYFGTMDPKDFNWNKEVLIYNEKTNSWKSVGQVPFDAPCGEGLVLKGNKIYSINGEIKPGVRTDRIYAGTLIF